MASSFCLLCIDVQGNCLKPGTKCGFNSRTFLSPESVPHLLSIITEETSDILAVLASSLTSTKWTIIDLSCIVHVALLDESNEVHNDISDALLV